jgi:hypothetical protein
MIALKLLHYCHEWAITSVGAAFQLWDKAFDATMCALRDGGLDRGRNRGPGLGFDLPAGPEL